MTWQRVGEIDHFLVSREWRTIRMRVLERDGAKCSCCGRAPRHGVVMNVDHIKPRGVYPELALDVSNLQILCNECNQGKGNKFSTDWRAHARTGTPSEEVERARQMDALCERMNLLPGEEVRLRGLDKLRAPKGGGLGTD